MCPAFGWVVADASPEPVKQVASHLATGRDSDAVKMAMALGTKFSATFGLRMGGQREGLRLRLGYRPPLDFGLMLQFLRRRMIPGIERIEEDGYARVIGPPDRPALLRVHDVGPIVQTARMADALWGNSAPASP